MNFAALLKQLLGQSAQGGMQGGMPQPVRPTGQFESLPPIMNPQQMAAKGNQNMSRGYDSYGGDVEQGLPISPLQILINRMRSMKR